MFPVAAMRRAALAVAMPLLLWAIAGPAVAGGCPCPKEKMIALYGTVSVYGHQPPGPRAPRPHRDGPWPVIAGSQRLSYPSLTPHLDRIGDPVVFGTLFVVVPD